VVGSTSGPVTCHAQRRPQGRVTTVEQDVDELSVASNADDPLGQLSHKLGMTLERLPGVTTRQDLDTGDRSIGESSSEPFGS